MSQSRPRSLVIVALLMMIFGLAEVATAFSHNFFGISTARGTTSAWAGAAIGVLYAWAGLLTLFMKKRAAALAIAFLVLDILGRIAMVVTGLYPVHSSRQVMAMILGTSIVAGFAVYIGSKWSFFS